MRGFEGLDVGDRLCVELIGTDIERGFIDFVRAERGQGIKKGFFEKGQRRQVVLEPTSPHLISP
jgi:hypothetical protein